MPGDNDIRLMDFLAELGRSQGVMVFKATLDYARKGIPINLEAFIPPWATVQPLDERAVYAFDKDTMYKQRCLLRDVQDHSGQRVCTLSTIDREAILPRNVFTSRSPNQIFFNQRLGVSRIVYVVAETVVHSCKLGRLVQKDRYGRWAVSRFTPPPRIMLTRPSSIRSTCGGAHPEG
jgi:hypothetical protein